MLSTILLIFVTPAYFLTVGTHQVALIILMAAIFGVAASIATGTLVSFISESFPTTERVTGNTSYNISAAYFGGFAPVISIALITTLHSPLAPAYYVMIAGVMSVVVLSFARDTGRMENLPETESLYVRK
jgi:MHS family proline/betaine transporter-like MFS transporter